MRLLAAQEIYEVLQNRSLSGGVEHTAVAALCSQFQEEGNSLADAAVKRQLNDLVCEK